MITREQAIEAVRDAALIGIMQAIDPEVGLEEIRDLNAALVDVHGVSPLDMAQGVADACIVALEQAGLTFDV